MSTLSRVKVKEYWISSYPATSSHMEDLTVLALLLMELFKTFMEMLQFSNSRISMSLTMNW